MIQDLRDVKKGMILVNDSTKRTYLVTQSEQVTLHRVELLNLTDNKIESYENLAESPLFIKYDDAKAPYGFNEVTFDFATQWLLEKNKEETLKFHLQQLGKSSAFQEDTPTDKILKTSSIN